MLCHLQTNIESNVRKSKQMKQIKSILTNIIQFLIKTLRLKFFWMFIVLFMLTLVSTVVSIALKWGTIESITNVSKNHWHILISLIPIFLLLLMIVSEFLWLSSSDENTKSLKGSPLWFIISLVIVFALFFTTPWKWISPILTVVNTIWIPLLWKNNKNTKIENTENRVNKPTNDNQTYSTNDDKSCIQNLSIKSRKYKKPLRYK